MRLRHVLVAVLVLLLPVAAQAFDGLFDRMRHERELASLFKEEEIRADVQAGIFFGTGIEQWKRLPNGGLRIERSWEYTHVRHPEKGAIALQVHGGGDHTKEFVRYRNIRVKKL